MSKYNGHKNYNCWNVSLYIDNEYPLYLALRDLLQTDKSKDIIAAEMVTIMSEYFSGYGGATGYTYPVEYGRTPDNVKITFNAVREHLRGLDRKDY